MNRRLLGVKKVAGRTSAGDSPCSQLPMAGDRGPGQKGLWAPCDARPSVPRVPSTPSASVHRPSPSWPSVSVWKPLQEALGTAERGLCSLDQRGSHHPQPSGDTRSTAVRRGSALQGDESPKGTDPTAPQGSAGTLKSWVKTVNAGAVGRTRPSCTTCSGLLPRSMTRTHRE